MGRLLPFPRLKMYLIQLRRPYSTFDLIQHHSSSCSIDNTLLSHAAPYPSSNPPYACSSLSMLSVATCVRLPRSEISSVRTNPKLIRHYRKRGRVAAEIKNDCSIIKAAEGTRQYRRYRERRACINNLKWRSQREVLSETVSPTLRHRAHYSRRRPSSRPSLRQSTPSTVALNQSITEHFQLLHPRQDGSKTPTTSHTALGSPL
jgi:hypothetical protein